MPSHSDFTKTLRERERERNETHLLSAFADGVEFFVDVVAYDGDRRVALVAEDMQHLYRRQQIVLVDV